MDTVFNIPSNLSGAEAYRERVEAREQAQRDAQEQKVQDVSQVLWEKKRAEA